MKFIKYITPALFCAALTLQSCEHFLDTKPMESYSEDLVWSLKSTADAFVLQTYNNVLPFYHDIRTEEQWTLNSVMRQNCPNEARDLMNRDWSWGFNQFGTIRRCMRPHTRPLHIHLESASQSHRIQHLLIHRK